MKEYRIETHYFVNGEWFADIWLFENGMPIDFIKKVKRNDDGSMSPEYGNKLGTNWIAPQFVYA